MRVPPTSNTIVTKRLTLKGDYNLHPSGLMTMVHWLQDPEVVQFSEQRHKEHNAETQAHYIIDGPAVFRQIYAGKKFIGTITADIDRNNQVANVGILIGEKTEWGKGYGTEAWQALCNHLLTNGIRKIEAGAMSCNLGMIKIFQKTGMYCEGQLDKHFMLTSEGGYITKDLVQYARFA